MANITYVALGCSFWIFGTVIPQVSGRLEAPSWTPSPHMAMYPVPWEQISSLIILVSTRLGNTPKIENTGSTSWKPLRSSSEHALDDDDDDESLHSFAPPNLPDLVNVVGLCYFILMQYRSRYYLLSTIISNRSEKQTNDCNKVNILIKLPAVKLE